MGCGLDPGKSFHRRKTRLVIQVSKERHEIVGGLVVGEKGPQRLDHLTLDVNVGVA